MKKIALLFFSTLVLSSCSIDDDGPRLNSVFAEVIADDLPESFEMGKTYVVEVTYQLPDACHRPAGLQLSRGADFGDERRDVYVAGVATYDMDAPDCTIEVEDVTELQETQKFSLVIDEDEPYTFYFWIGVDEENESVFHRVEVPVVTPEPETEA